MPASRSRRSPCSWCGAGDAQASSYYDPLGSNPLNAPYVAGVFQDAETVDNPDRHYQTLVDAFTLANTRSRLCDASSGRLAYSWNVFTNIFGKICAVVGSGQMTTEVPNNDAGKAFVDLAGIGNNPLREGSALIHLSLAHADRVTVKIYDVSGRLVRTLADGQMFKAGRVDPALTWDGLDNGGRRVARGAARGARATLRNVLGYVNAAMVEAACGQLPVRRDAVGTDGTVADPEIRASIAAVLAALRDHVLPEG